MFKFYSGLCNFSRGHYWGTFVWFNSLHPSQQFFSHMRMGLPVLNQYKAADKVSC